MVRLSPLAATRSRARNHGEGPKPLRSRLRAAWARWARSFSRSLWRRFGSGPSSILDVTKFQSLEALHDRRREAAYVSHIGESEQMRPSGISTKLSLVLSFLHPGWRQLQRGTDPNFFSILLWSTTVKVLLPARSQTHEGYFCRWNFLVSITHWCGFSFLEPLSQRNGIVQLPQGRGGSLWLSAQSRPYHLHVAISPSLASAVSSLRTLYTLWKAGNFSRVSLREHVGNMNLDPFFSRSLECTVSSCSLTSSDAGLSG